MASVGSEIETNYYRRSYWGAIWAGTFTFIAVWSVFEALGLSIFSGSANSDMLGLSIWSAILTIIAMFVAGRTTGRLAGVTNSREGAMQGMVMFGLSVTAFLILFMGGTAFGRTEITVGGHSAYVLSMFATYGWAFFVSLFLGWLAALSGGSTAHKELPQHTAVVQQQVRHA